MQEPIMVHRAVIPVVGIYYYTDKDVAKVKKELHRILYKIEESTAPSTYIIELFEYILDYPYILDAYKKFKEILERKVGELTETVIRYVALEKYQKLYDVTQKVKAIL